MTWKVPRSSTIWIFLLSIRGSTAKYELVTETIIDFGLMFPSSHFGFDFFLPVWHMLLIIMIVIISFRRMKGGKNIKRLKCVNQWSHSIFYRKVWIGKKIPDGLFSCLKIASKIHLSKAIFYKSITLQGPLSATYNTSDKLQSVTSCRLTNWEKVSPLSEWMKRKTSKLLEVPVLGDFPASCPSTQHFCAGCTLKQNHGHYSVYSKCCHFCLHLLFQ